MNLLEHYIKEVIKVTECKNKTGTQKYLKVNMVCDCYGVTEQTTHWFLPSEWEQAKKDGYYLA